MGNLDAISTTHAPANHAFDGLRRQLHDSADPYRIAAKRAFDTVGQLRTRADYFRIAMEVYAGHSLADWYADLAARHERLANEIEAESESLGMLGGVA